MGYATTFQTVESPLSESGLWKNGGADGLDWCNHVVGVAGKDKGSQPGTGFYDDSIAHLTLDFSPNQMAQATVWRSGDSATELYEVEILLRFDITANFARGYEILYSLRADNAYHQVVRWNGIKANSDNSNNGFSYMSTSGPGLSVVGVPQNGDVIMATIEGNIIKTYLNGQGPLLTSDITAVAGSVWTDGRPGIGLYSSGGANVPYFGFSDFQAQSLDSLVRGNWKIR